MESSIRGQESPSSDTIRGDLARPEPSSRKSSPSIGVSGTPRMRSRSSATSPESACSPDKGSDFEGSTATECVLRINPRKPSDARDSESGYRDVQNYDGSWTVPEG